MNRSRGASVLSVYEGIMYILELKCKQHHLPNRILMKSGYFRRQTVMLCQIGREETQIGLGTL